jgi:hypothetical protein
MGLQAFIRAAPLTPGRPPLALGSIADRRGRHSGYRFPPEIIQHAIWLYIRFTLSFRDVEDLLAERGILISRPALGEPFRADGRSGPKPRTTCGGGRPRRQPMCQNEVVADLKQRRPSVESIIRIGMDQPARAHSMIAVQQTGGPGHKVPCATYVPATQCLRLCAVLEDLAAATAGVSL